MKNASMRRAPGMPSPALAESFACFHRTTGCSYEFELLLEIARAANEFSLQVAANEISTVSFGPRMCAVQVAASGVNVSNSAHIRGSLH
ncbi:hypothetical protein Q3A80_14955 [Burkholderia sp. SR8]|uniref:hypothetical protein n=1 Tax=Burkholderia sp. SR8 TaxID=3062277 RepID=UPI004064197C